MRKYKSNYTLKILIDEFIYGFTLWYFYSKTKVTDYYNVAS